MKKARIAMIGAWGHGYGMLSYLEKSKPEFAEVVALAEVSPDEKFDNYRSNFEFLRSCQVYSDYRKMLDEVKPDIAVVSTALKNLSEATLAAARAGCAIYAEKPVAATFEQLDEIRQAVEQNNSYLLFTMCNPSSPQLCAIRELYESGQLGQIAVINARKSYPWNEERVEQFPISLGGTIGWVGIHALEFIYAATGKLFSKVGAMESNIRSDSFSQCPDNTVMMFELTGGGHASISVDYCRPNGRPVYGDDWIRVVGTKGIAEANMSRKTLRFTDNESETYSLQLPTTDAWFSLLPQAMVLNQKVEYCREMTRAAFELNRTAIIAQQAAETGKILDI